MTAAGRTYEVDILIRGYDLVDRFLALGMPEERGGRLEWSDRNGVRRERALYSDERADWREYRGRR